MQLSTIATLLAASVALAATPDGFQPATQVDLTVTFRGAGSAAAVVDASGGKAVARANTAKVPTISTNTPLIGTYAVMMIDMDLPGGGSLLHWMQTGMTAQPSAASGPGTAPAAVGQLAGGTAAAPYFAPNPPAKTPRTHRYVQLVLDTTTVAGADAALKAAAATRQGFQAEQALTAAGLTDANVVGGNFFTVTNGV